MYKIEKMEWDSNHYGKKIGSFEIEDINLKDINVEDYKVLIAKIDSKEKEKTHLLEKLGFNLMDTLITFKIEFLNEEKKIMDVVLAAKEDLDDIKKIARNSYILDHFHSNKNLDKNKSDDLYMKWIENKFNQGEKIYIFKEKNIVKGFLLSKERENEAIIDLIAVDEKCRGKSIGEKLIKNFQSNNIRKQSFVGTQIANIGAIKLYEKIGYKIEKFTHIFHKNISFGE